MLDPRRETVVIRNRTGEFENKTRDVARIESAPEGRFSITFNKGGTYTYGRERVRVLHRLADNLNKALAEYPRPTSSASRLAGTSMKPSNSPRL